MLKPFKLITAGTLEEAIASANQGCKILAGGTDVIVMMHKDVTYPNLIDISKLEELKGITFDKEKGLTIGAFVTHSEVEQNESIREFYPALVDGCSKVGSTQVRNKGTIGGNLANASPAADSAGPLLLYDAKVRIAGDKGERIVDLQDFFTGVKRTVLTQDEIIVSISLAPPAKNSSSAYLKLMKRGALEIGIMSTGIRFDCDGAGNCSNARITLSAVAPTPIRVPEAEAVLVGGPITKERILQAAEIAYQTAAPKTWRNSEEWSKDMVKTFLPQTAEIAQKRMKGRC